MRLLALLATTMLALAAKGQPRPERPAPGVLLTKATDMG
jgi:hypothetical protein